MSYLTRTRAVLAAIDARDLRRAIDVREPGLIDFASNDYLALSRAPAVVAALHAAHAGGSGGSRLLSGAHPEHAALETELAQFLGRERVLLFSSGYLAAMGAMHAAAQVVDHVYSDELNHASIIDGLRLTNVPRTIFAHRQLPAAHDRTAPALVVTESVFGMSGDSVKMDSLLAGLGADDLLVVDEAHALGVCGAQGAGIARGYDDARIVILGTLSKAFGCAGGFIAGPADFIELLISTARTFIFDTSLAPALASAGRAALRAAIKGDPLRAQLHRNVERARAGLRRPGARARATAAHGAILPFLVGDARAALELSRRLRSKGIFAPAIRPPTVAAGTARLRLVFRSDHTADEIDLLTASLREKP